MPVTVTMPSLGDAISEATIERWLKAPGEAVAKDEPLLELMSDKVTIEVPAPDDGTLATILVEAGQKVPTGTPLAIVALAGEAASPPEAAAASSERASTSPAAAAPAPATSPAVRTDRDHAPVPSAASPTLLTSAAAAASPHPATAGPLAPASSSGAPAHSTAPAGIPPAAPTNGHAQARAGAATGADRRLYSPRVRQLMADHGLSEAELGGLTGSGLGGRLTSDDLRAYLAQRPASPPRAAASPPPPVAPALAQPALAAPARPATPASPSAATPPPTAPAAGDETRQPVTGLRRAIAEHMERSVSLAPHAWQTIEINLHAVDQHRAAARAAFEAAEGFGLTYLPFFVRAVIDALRAVPALNAVWADDQLTLRRELNLGIAVAIEGGLVVPVIAGADGLNMIGLARAIRDRAERARSGRLAPTELSGGTFTVNNTGAFGSILSRPIINQPQVAIVTMEAVVRRPVVTAEDAIAIRPLLNACLSYDERAVDAATAGLFLSTLRRYLEEWAEPIG